MLLRELLASKAIYCRIDLVIIKDKENEQKTYKDIHFFNDIYEQVQDLPILYIKPCCEIEQAKSVYKTCLQLQNYLEITLRG